MLQAPEALALACILTRADAPGGTVPYSEALGTLLTALSEATTAMLELLAKPPRKAGTEPPTAEQLSDALIATQSLLAASLQTHCGGADAADAKAECALEHVHSVAAAAAVVEGACGHNLRRVPTVGAAVDAALEPADDDGAEAAAQGAKRRRTAAAPPWTAATAPAALLQIATEFVHDQAIAAHLQLDRWEDSGADAPEQPESTAAMQAGVRAACDAAWDGLLSLVQHFVGVCRLAAAPGAALPAAGLAPAAANFVAAAKLAVEAAVRGVLPCLRTLPTTPEHCPGIGPCAAPEKVGLSGFLGTVPILTACHTDRCYGIPCSCWRAPVPGIGLPPAPTGRELLSFCVCYGMWMPRHALRAACAVSASAAPLPRVHSTQYRAPLTLACLLQRSSAASRSGT